MREPTDEVRKTLRLPANLWERVRDYRFNAHIDTETDTFVRLLEVGLSIPVERGKSLIGLTEGVNPSLNQGVKARGA